MKEHLLFLLKAGIIAGSGGLIFGYDVGIISGSMFQLVDTFDLNSVQEGLVVSLLSVGSIGGCFLGGYLSDKYGRWRQSRNITVFNIIFDFLFFFVCVCVFRTIQLQNVIFITGFFIMAFSSNIASLYIGRLILGVASAFAAVADVPYLHEISPPSLRGQVTSTFEVMIVTGALLASVSSLILWDTVNGWRIMFLVPIVFTIFQSIGLLWLPESPKWLYQKGFTEECKAALSCVYVGDEAGAERVFDELQKGSQAAADEAKDVDFLLVFSRYRLSLVIIILLMALGQLSGSVVVRNYSPTIFNKAGYDRFASLVLNTIVSVINLVAVVSASIFIDRLGRRFMLCVGFLTAAVGMLVLSLGFIISADDVGVFFVGVVLTSVGFNIGFGPVGWILSSELFPTKIRGRSLCVSTVTRNIFEFCTNFLFLTGVSNIGASGTFFVFLCFSLVALGVSRFFLVETNGLDSQDILQLHSELCVWRTLMCIKRNDVCGSCWSKRERGEESDRSSLVNKRPNYSTKVELN